MNIYKNAFDIAFPTKIIKLRKKFIRRSPWLTSGILKSSIQKAKLFRIKLRKPTHLNISQYKNFCSTFNKVKRLAKSLYYIDQLEQNNNDIKQTWTILRQALNKQNNHIPISETFTINGNEISDPREIAEQFNIYFSEIGASISTSAPMPVKHYSSHLQGNFPTNLFMRLTNTDEIINITRQFKSKLFEGFDKVSSKLIKETIEHIAMPLTHIINKSLEMGVVPNNMKIAKLIPVFKSGDRKLFSNYRPISILPEFSKVMEKIVNDRLTDFLHQQNIIYEHQYGFRKKTLHYTQFYSF